MNPKIPENIDREVLKALRGRRSQVQLSRLLGFRFNQVYLWESGRRAVHWGDFELYCKILKRPLYQAITRHFALPDSHSIHEVLVGSLRSLKKGAIAKELGIGPSPLSRWLNGRADPPLREVFRIFNRTHLNFLEFLDEVVGAGKLMSIQTAVTETQRLKNALYGLPIAGAIAPALELREYQELKVHRPGVLAKRLGLTLQEEEEALRLLQAAGQIEMQNGKYRLKSFRVTLTEDKQRFIQNCQYWSERAARIPKRVGQKSFFGYRVFGVSSEAYAKLRQAQVNAYHAISEILKDETAPYDDVVVINFQTFFPEEG